MPHRLPPRGEEFDRVQVSALTNPANSGSAVGYRPRRRSRRGNDSRLRAETKTQWTRSIGAAYMDQTAAQSGTTVRAQRTVPVVAAVPPPTRVLPKREALWSSLGEELSVLVIDDDRAGNLVPQLLFVRVPQKPEVHDAGRHPAKDADHGLSDHLAHEHRSPGRLRRCTKFDDAHAEQLLCRRLPVLEYDRSPDVPANDRGEDVKNPFEQRASKTLPRRRQLDAGRKSLDLAAELASEPGAPVSTACRARPRNW